MKLWHRLVVCSVWFASACGGSAEEADEHEPDGDAGHDIAFDAGQDGDLEEADADAATLDMDAASAFDAASFEDAALIHNVAGDTGSGVLFDAAEMLDAGAQTDSGAGMDAGALSEAGDPSDASLLDSGEVPDAESSPDAGSSPDAESSPDAAAAAPVPDLQQSGFLAYGQLKVTFDKAVDATALSVSLSPARPAGIAATKVAQASERSVLISLNTYHLPLDYTLKITSATYSVELTIPGQNNGSRTMFVSSHAGNGDLRSWLPELSSAPSGRAAGDAVCQSEADAAGLKGVFRAFLSSDESADPYDAVCRMLDRTGTWTGNCGLAQPPVDQAPVLDQGGLPIVNGASGVADGEWLSTIRYRANGDAASGHAWTGSTRTGRSASGDCVGFIDSGATPRGVATADPQRYLPDFFYSFGCNDSGSHLLCVQVGAGFFAESALHQRTGKAVFITNDAFSFPDPDTGALAAADTFCQDAAKSAGYTTHANFVAWMSDASNHAPCRLVASGGTLGANKCGLGSWPSTGPWVRRDGFVVAKDMSELLSGNIRAPLLYNAAGSFLDKSVYTITNTWNDGTPAGKCSGGIATGVAAWSLYYSPSSCAVARPLVCFER